MDRKKPDHTDGNGTPMSPFDDTYKLEANQEFDLGARDDDFKSESISKGSDGLFEEMVVDSTQDLGERPNDVVGSSDGSLKKSAHRTRKLKREKAFRQMRDNFKDAIDEFKDKKESDDLNERDRSEEYRTVYFNIPLPQDMVDEDGEAIVKYPRNKIRTTKYTPISFFPKNIFLQFNNFANIYFLILCILGAFQIFGVSNPGLAAVPLIVIVILTSIKDGFEDSRRTLLDMEVNNTKTHILTGVENSNVPFDKVSMWRKFKKTNTKILMRVFQYFGEHFTSAGKEARQHRLQQKKKFKRAGTALPRSSLDSMQSIRMSGDYLRPSLDPQIDNQWKQENTGANLVNTNLPVNEDSKFKKNYWKNVRVGDIIRIHNNEEIPADIILLSTSDEDGVCCIETKNLDGETNLKIRQALKCTSNIRSPRNIARTNFWVESEGPHANLFNYQGNFKWLDPTDRATKNEPVSINNVLLRGCTLRNTKWAMGMAIFTGDDTKIMLNSGVTPTKKSRISRELNLSVLINFIVLFVLCLIAAIVNSVYYHRKPKSRDFFEFGTIAKTPTLNGFVSFWVALILYQSLVPISLYISVEIIKTCQAIFIYLDVMLYYEKLDYPCTAKTWSISDDLGQVEYIFSDKTGTLTQNVMEFKKCTVNGVSYGRAYTEALAGLRKRQGIDVDAEAKIERREIAHDREVMIDELSKISDNSQFYPDELTFISKEFAYDIQGTNGAIQQKCCEHFMLALALCHTALVEHDPKDRNRLEIKAQSPDEAALVTTARDVGFGFVGKTKTGLIVEMQGVQKEFELLNILDFNSTRKRMSCIIKIPPKTPDGNPSALLICKGADTVIYSRLSRKSGVNDETVLEKTALHLEQYATEGLRTLCVAQREFDWATYEAWNEKYNVAAAALSHREEELEAVYELIEKDMVLLGGTAIEDKLQDGVPNSIAMLGNAGIKLWVLTGDKVETAINIGFSCNLLNSEMQLLVIKSDGEDVAHYGSTPQEIVSNLLTDYLRDNFGLQGTEEEINHAKNEHSVPKGEFAVIIDGEALKIALANDEDRRKFLLLCKNCKSVLCCRVSPAQKAAVVKLVKNTLDVMTLAIGDGSNDVAMIQAADVGVGIAGEEGRQAVMCSDFAIGQFRYLTRLLLVHGRWCYKRLAEMIPQFFYKNVIFTFALFWNGVHNNYDGSYLFEFTYLTFYNLAFTSIPVIIMGVLDQDVSAKIAMAVPELYRSGILRLDWNQGRFVWYMLDGLYQSVICYFFPYLLYRKNNIVTKNGLGLDHRFYVGIPVAGICVIAANCYLLMEQRRWDCFSCFFIFLSVVIYFGWTGIWSSSLNSFEFFKSASRVFDTPAYWAVIAVGSFFCLLPRFTYDCVQKMLYPSDVDIIREMWSSGMFDRYPENYDPSDPDQEKLEAVYSTPFGDTSYGHIDIASSSNNPSTSVVDEEYAMGNIPSHKEGRLDKGSENRMNVGGPQFRKSINGNMDAGWSAIRTSLDRTRNDMLASRELDTRFSVERARVSLDLPGLTKAETLLK